MAQAAVTNAQTAAVTRDVVTRKATYQQMVRDAIRTLADRKGTTRQAITKYIVLNYRVCRDVKQVHIHVKRALLKGVEDDTLTRITGTGVAGRFKTVENVKGERKTRIKSAGKDAERKKRKSSLAAKATVQRKVAMRKKVAARRLSVSMSKSAATTATSSKQTTSATNATGRFLPNVFDTSSDSDTGSDSSSMLADGARAINNPKTVVPTTKPTKGKAANTSKAAVSPKASAKTSTANAKSPKGKVKGQKASAKSPKANAKSPKGNIKGPKGNAKSAKGKSPNPKVGAKSPKAGTKSPKANTKSAKSGAKSPKSSATGVKAGAKSPKASAKSKVKKVTSETSSTQTKKAKTAEKK